MLGLHPRGRRFEPYRNHQINTIMKLLEQYHELLFNIEFMTEDELDSLINQLETEFKRRTYN